MKFGGKVSLTKLLSRLSHDVCRLLSSPVLLRISSLFLRDGQLVLSRHPGPGKEPIKGYGDDHLDLAQFTQQPLILTESFNL